MKAMRFFGFPTKIICLLQALYKTSQSAVRVNGELTDWFNTTVGVRQGCVISPQLFNILLEVVISTALQESEIGVNISGFTINNLRFADDIVIIAETQDELQTLVNRVQEASSNFGLKINISKTQVQVISKQKQTLTISIDTQKLEQVPTFVYLGGTITEIGTCEEDVKNRISKAVGAVQRLHNIWQSNDIRKETKLQLYHTLILSILLYGSETWTLKKEDERRLLSFEMACLRKFLGITRLDKIRNQIIRDTLDHQKTVIDTISERRLKYFGHILRMGNERYPKITYEGRIHGKRPRGRPPKKWLDCIKSDCQARGLPSLSEASRLATNRTAWLKIVKQMPSHSLLVWKA
jgi:hypothetical protein